jgi:hypothetical protein
MSSEKALRALLEIVPDEVKQECYQSMGIGQASSWRILYYFAGDYPETFVEKMVDLIKDKEAAYEAGRAAERERIVGRLNARKQTAAIGEERALKQDSPDWVRAAKHQQETALFDEAIAIAREEGDG